MATIRKSWRAGSRTRRPTTSAHGFASRTIRCWWRVEGSTILAAGSVTDAGEITLNDVSPEARFLGISRAKMQSLEQRASARGSTRCTLTSTESAHRFYRALGYVDDGPVVHKHGAHGGYPMSKPIARAGRGEI
ncbi:GNAT family N-acetyltransferase [Lichenifustis flavocetrariae]|uniref:GNAT family N-acetyltransferase n=1 Tax=Lichenifustis flavocetrariae TaxID=2949735 RepID=A0AA41YS99_9HYPH|nr:GNAT family N-acetyltransferase [Lichenifustis flavocetrariae]MCW6507634.1 GNAT family N-acetyltransferase [Lichenifustis flavocetrariae]